MASNAPLLKQKAGGKEASYEKHLVVCGKTGKIKMKSLDALFGLFFRNPKHAEKRADYEDLHEPLQGDIYRYMALYGQRAHNPIQLFGMVCVMLVQIIGPALILMENLRAMDWSKTEFFKIGGETTSDKVQEVGQRVLGSLFLSLFILNGWRYNLDTMNCSVKLQEMMTRLELRFQHFPKFKSILKDNTNFAWITVGAFVNSWVIIMCTLDMAFVLMLEDDAKGVVFDSLGLLFLYNLDDVTGDFALLDESDWDEERMGMFYEDINASDADSGALPSDSVVRRFPLKTCNVLGQLTKLLIVASCVFPFAVLFVEPGKQG